jgi:GNAT superfamily N-acetyltransferase
VTPGDMPLPRDGAAPGGSSPAGSTAAFRFRPMRPEDLDAAVDVYYAAQDHLMDRSGQPRYGRNPAPLRGLLAHLLASDAERSHVAVARTDEVERVVAFGAGYRRDRLAFLAFLFVRPEVQSRGIGRELFAACLAEAAAPGRADDSGGRPIRATCVDSLQPVSTGLYAAAGLVPRLPIHTLIGSIDRTPLPPLPADVEATAFERVVEEDGHASLASAVEALDREVLGWTRGTDHRFWRLDGRRGLLLRRASEAIGYGYAQGSGRLGPLVVRDAALAPGLLGQLARLVSPAGAWQAIVPGPFEPALRSLLAAGLRIDGSAGLLCSSEPIRGLERVLPAGYALL